MSEESSDGLRNALDVLSGAAPNFVAWDLPSGFDPNRLLDALMAKMQLENDEALAYKLEVIHPIVRMIREGKLAMTPSLLMSWVQEATGIPAAELQIMLQQTTTPRIP